MLTDAPDKAVHEGLVDLDWELSDARTDELTHGLHSYPAKFIPQLPARFIELLSEPGELVVDPFCGGGTSGVEALRLGRDFLGVDANPFGVLLGRVKTSPLTKTDRSALARLIQRVSQPLHCKPTWVPDIPNIDRWYAPEIVDALSVLQRLASGVRSPGARDLSRVAFAKVAAQMSYQESETRYVSKPRPINADEPRRRYVLELERMSARANSLLAEDFQRSAKFVEGDARDRQSYPIADDSAGLIVTSPPYPNAYDYHLYHRFRLFWLGEDPGELRRQEIGSHLKHQTDSDPVAAFEQDMTEVLISAMAVLRPGRFCAMIIGDAVFKGETYPTAQRVSEIAAELGFTTLPLISRRLPTVRRSVTVAGRRLVREEIMVIRKPVQREMVALISPPYRRFPYEDQLAEREVRALTGLTVTDSQVEVAESALPDTIERLNSAAFWHGVQPSGRLATPTLQHLREGDGASGRRKKNSTYLTHGLHRYKGKFYPQLAKALINLSSVDKATQIVVDPFGGSGTVLLESVLNGFNAVSIDCNPLAHAVATAKVDALSLPTESLSRLAEGLVAHLREWSEDEDEVLVCSAFNASTIAELESWFPDPVLRKLSFLLRSIRSTDDSRFARLAEVIVSDLVREVSQQEPRDLRIRRRAEPLLDAPVFELFEERLRTVVERLCVHGVPTVGGSGTAVIGDSADPDVMSAALDGRSVGAVVSSPPYATALPYLDTDRLSLSAVFGYDKRQRAALEQRLIGSREVNRSEEREWTEAITTERYQQILPPSTLSFLCNLHEAVCNDRQAGFRKRQMPAVLLRYFVGMAKVLQNVESRLTPGGHLWFVLGDSRTTVGERQLTIPTIDEVASIGKVAGLQLVERIPITVTREDVVHSRNAITENVILHMMSAQAG